MMETETVITPIPDSGFGSLSAIRVAHLELMDAAATKRSRSGGRPSPEDMRTFLAHARKAGAWIEGESERRSVQRMLDYWSTELMASAELSGEDFGPVLLDPFTDGAGAAGEVPQVSIDRLMRGEAKSAEFIRLSALARQWKNTGLRGYLLSGDALKAAEALDDDPEIAALIDASRTFEAQVASDRERTRNGALVVLGLLLAAVTLTAIFLWFAVADARNLTTELMAEQKAETLQRETYATQQADARTEAESRALEAEAARVRATERLAQLERQQRILDAALGVIGAQLQTGEIVLTDLTPELRAKAQSALVEQLRAGTLTMAALPPDLAGLLRPLVPDAPASAFNLDLQGYQADFLGDGLAVPLPALSAEQMASAYEGGEPLLYANYSIVLDATRRMAFFSAANLDRERRSVLPQVSDTFQYDPRVPEGNQLDSAWQVAHRVDFEQLVSRNDISWGPYFEGGTTAAAAAVLLDQVTNVYTNAAPQYSSSSRYAWLYTDNYVRVVHNPAASRVTIFTGPAFVPGECDGTVPSHFWKVAVSASPASAKGASSDLVVEAFVVPNVLRTSGGVNLINPATFRVPVSDIEAMTGLDFGERVRAAGAILERDEALPADISSLRSASDADRRRLTLAATVALSSGTVSATIQNQIVAAVLDLGDAADLPAADRSSVLSILRQVPAGFWENPAWPATTARARRLVVDLEAAAAADGSVLDDIARSQLATIRANLRLDELPPQAVSFQFAGMTRGSAEALSAKLRQLGWAIPLPGEERTGLAAGVNEVRYNPASEADRIAATRLAADIVAAGHSANVEPAENETIALGTVEVWVSI